MSLTTCLVALALALMALECTPSAFNTSTIHDPSRVARATTNRCQCGKKLTGNRIVGGQETEINEYPWQAALEDEDGFQFCGGSLITDRHVLTAAHCLKDITEASALKVVLKEHNLQLPSETQTVTKGVLRITKHSQYNDVNEVNDIAMLELESPVVVSSKLLPVCLPSNSKLTYAGKTATVTGWGDTSFNGTGSDVLKELDVPVLSHASCKKETNYSPSEIKSTMLCAGAEGEDSCRGDSGGPLVFKNAKSRYDQIGVVSWGRRCAAEGYPGVYTRVTKYLPWIKSKTKNGKYCSAT